MANNIQLGSIKLGDFEIGKWRILSEKGIKELRR